MQLTQEEIQAIVDEALTLASNAANKYLGDIGGDQYPCGFAWVKIRPARGPFVKYLRDAHLGETDSYEGGFRVYNPSKNHCQNMDAKMEGARAFAGHLKKHGIDAYAASRID